MAKHWDGYPERRLAERRIGWKTECEKCATIQNNTNLHRQTVCGKISALKTDHAEDVKRLDGEILDIRDDVKAALPWRHFIWITGLAALIIGGGFGFFGLEMRSQRIDTSANLRSIDEALDRVVNNQTLVLYRLKMLDEKHENGGPK